MAAEKIEAVKKKEMVLIAPKGKRERSLFESVKVELPPKNERKISDTYRLVSVTTKPNTIAKY